MYGRAGGRSRPPHERDQLIDSARGAASQRECLTNGHRCSPGPRLNRRRWRPAGSGPAWSGGGRVRSAAGATGHTSARGSSADFIGSCRGCDIDGIALARALVGDVGEAWTAYDDPGPLRADILHRSGFTALSCPAVARPSGRPGATTSGRLGRLWSAAEAVSGTPGAAYLESRGFSAPWPAAVRWLPADVAGDLRPRLPVCAAWAVCYRFAAADDGDTHAIQVEAVRDDGARVLFATQGKRPSVTGSRFAAGARVFVARAGGPDVALCESVIFGSSRPHRPTTTPASLNRDGSCRSMPPIGSTMEPLPSSLTSSGGWRRTCGRFGFRTY